MIVVSYGMGTNSTAVFVGMHERGIKPDLILAANTGGEFPHIYDYLAQINTWLLSVGFPLVTMVQVTGELLEANCLRRKALPAIAYGFKSCSQRWKIEPQQKFLNNYAPAQEVLKRKEKIVRAIGYDYGEQRRARPPADDEIKKYENWFPLIDWKWDREDCIAAIERAGLPQPGKSSCFFCPNMDDSEVRQMNEQYPELALRAIEMERNADLDVLVGLGRDWSWESLLKNGELFEFPKRKKDMPCGCYDGD